ncbi:MAG: hypothetical protein AAB561_00530 [Patescibacteria group bacterium]
MNNKLLLGIGAVVVVVAAVAIFSGGDEGTGGKTSLEGLLKSNKAQECSYSVDADGAKMSATVYIANGKMRTDSTVTTGGQTMKSNMIVDGQTSYVWSDGTSQGFKMTLDNLKSEEPTGSNQQGQAVDFEKEFDYSCKGWSVDNSKFTPPSNIKFTDFSSMMPSLLGTPVPKTSGSGDSSQCATCDQVPAGSAREMCKQSLGCK